MWRRIGILACAAALGACASGPAPQPVATLKSVPVAELFPVALRDICFGALTSGEDRTVLARLAGFTPSTEVSDRYREAPDEVFYTAAASSTPLLVSFDEAGSRCNVIAVRGNHEELKALGEEQIAAFSASDQAGEIDHLSFIERNPAAGYALKFTLLSGDALETETVEEPGTDG